MKLVGRLVRHHPHPHSPRPVVAPCLRSMYSCLPCLMLRPWVMLLPCFAICVGLALCSGLALARLALPCRALPSLPLPCFALLALPCLALPRLASPCLALPCLAICLAAGYGAGWYGGHRRRSMTTRLPPDTSLHLLELCGDDLKPGQGQDQADQARWTLHALAPCRSCS